MAHINPAPFYLSEEVSDVKIQLGEKLIPAHKLVLSANSDVFKSMFKTPMRESPMDVVQIEDNEVYFLEFLRFIYTGEIDVKNVAQVFLLADKYNKAHKAFTYCEDILVKNLNMDNAMKLYDLSHSVGVKDDLAEKSRALLLRHKGGFANDKEVLSEFAAKYPDFLFELCSVSACHEQCTLQAQATPGFKKYKRQKQEYTSGSSPLKIPFTIDSGDDSEDYY